MWVKIPWRMAWQPSPVFFLGESHGPRSPTGYSPQSRKESETTETTQHAIQQGTLNNRLFFAVLEARNLRSRRPQDFLFFFLARLLSLVCSWSSSCSHGVLSLCVCVLIPSPFKVPSHTRSEAVTFRGIGIKTSTYEFEGTCVSQ